MPDKVGRVYLVGAGPGDPGLITLRGRECLTRADLVLYDYLANPRLLDYAPPTAERVCLGRHGSGHTPGQDRMLLQAEINSRMITAARSGRVVVRLKGGDPAIFARGAEEAEALAAAGIPFEIVPGVTAALAAGSYAGIPVTHRELASAVALVTGHQQDDEPAAAGLDYAALAAFPGTLVFYMGVTTARDWTAALIAAGKSAETPAAIVRHCSWPDQQTVQTTLGTVADELMERRTRPPVIVIVGEVTRLAPTLDWFTRRPLFGQTILVTRPERQSQELCDALAELGAATMMQPAIALGPPDHWGPVDAALAAVDDFDWLVFSSINGVRFLLDRLLERHGDVRRLGRVRLAAIGPGTAAALADYRLRPDYVPTEEFRAETLAAGLVGEASGRRFLLARASRGREVLADRLRAAGGDVTQIVVYSSRDVISPAPGVAEALAAGRIDWVTVTSSAIARSLVGLFGDALRKTRLCSISPVTSATLRELGHEPAAEARQYTTGGVVAAIARLADSAGKP